VGWSGERRLAASSRAHCRRAGPQPLGNWPPFAVLLGGHGRRLGPRRARLRAPILRRTMPTSRASRAQSPRSSDRRTVALARSATVASDRQERAFSAALLGGGSVAVSRSHPGGHRSGIWPTLPPPGVANFRLGSSQPKSRSCHQGWKLLPRNGDGFGQWIGLQTPKPASNATRERPDGGHKTRGIAGKTEKWRGPESNRGHHDFQAVASGALRRRKPHRNAVVGGAGARPVPADARRCAWV